jgi:hypothetical protein
VRDMQHLKDMARPAQSAGGQSGSARQVNQFRARGVLDEYKRIAILTCISEDGRNTEKRSRGSSDHVAEMALRIKERDADWRHKKTGDFPCSKDARHTAYNTYVRAKHRALVRNVQRTYIAKLTLHERVRMIVHALLTWYHHRK